MRSAIIGFLIVLSVLLPANASAGAAIYAIKTHPDGRAYLGSDVFVAGRTPDFSQNMLDSALDVTDDRVRHVATGLTLPLRTDHCAMRGFYGVRVQVAGFGEFLSFQHGGRGYYTCDPDHGPAFVNFSLEVDIGGPEDYAGPEGLARRLLRGGMMPEGDPAAIVCTSSTTLGMLKVDCERSGTFEGHAIQERGTVFVKGTDSFIKFSIACLAEECPTAAKGLSDLVAAIDVSSLQADAVVP